MLIEMRKLTKTYGEGDQLVHATQDVNLEIHEGDFIAVVGPSGSGKTTLLNLLAGLIGPTSGTIKHKAKEIQYLSMEERTAHRLENMGFIFQDYQLLPVLTASENVELPLQMKRLSQTEIDQKTKWALEQVGLGDKLNRYPRQLSGGQQQRVAIARAIAGRPSLILADEPTANLDSKTAQDIIDLFKKLNTEFKLTFVFSTHDQRLIDQVKRVLRIKDGQIQESNE
ncbi:MAG: ABC transporter ATP-binding protein [Bacteriovoracaceae bacterium]|nr:ABC transporter ATP-binding protein [Bacteriovoracaceae bacterium]